MVLPLGINTCFSNRLLSNQLYHRDECPVPVPTSPAICNTNYDLVHGLEVRTIVELLHGTRESNPAQCAGRSISFT